MAHNPDDIMRFLNVITSGDDTDDELSAFEKLLKGFDAGNDLLSSLQDYKDRIVYNKALKGRKKNIAETLSKVILSDENRIYFEDPADFIELLRSGDDDIVYVRVMAVESNDIVMWMITIDKIEKHEEKTA